MYWKYYRMIGMILLMFALTGCHEEPVSERNIPVDTNEIRYTLSDQGVLDIHGSGELNCKDFSFYGESGTDWDTIESIEKIVIHEGITGIGKDCFSYFDSLTSVDLPKGLKEIDANAFCGNVMLKHITIPDSVEKIGSHAFGDCQSLEQLTLPSSLKEYETNAVKGCYCLEKITNHSSQTWKLCSKKMHGTWYCAEQKVDEIKPGVEVLLRSEEYNIIYDLNGGMATDKLPDKFTYRDGVELPDTVERKGYSFAGWSVDSELSDSELGNDINDGTKGDKKVTAVWINFQVKNLNAGKIRVFWNMEDGNERTKYYEGFSCQIRYSKNPDMSDFEFIRTSEKDTDVVLDKLEKGKKYYIEYAVISDLDNWETIGELPWQGKESIIIK